MYSPKIINRKLMRFQEKFGWTPIEHTIEEVERASAFIQSLCTTDARGNLEFDSDNWTPKLKQFVLNERARCAIDCSYFLTRYFKIAADNQIIRFKFRSGQRAFYRVVQEMEADGKSIEIQILKARQQGLSTIVEGMMTHRALFVPGAKCSIASANDQKTYVMMGMMYTALEHIPWWIQPTQTKDKRSGAAILEFSHVGTQIVIQSGAMKGGAGQGTTPTAVHYSEVCDWTDPVTQIEEGVFKAVHPSPEILLILESTGNGNSGWWADLWRNNKEFYWQGRARLLPLFIPWFMTPELYPTPNWIHDHPVPKDWIQASETVAMTAKCEAYTRSTEMISRTLGENWTLPRQQQWYWEFMFQDHKRRRIEKSWLRQMPCDDYEALSGENDSVFEWETIANIQANRKKTIDVYGILGEGIAEKHDPLPMDVEKNEEPLMAEWKTPREERLEWIFMPLRAEPEKPQFDPLKKLLVYHHPEKGADYSIGVDSGTGVGGDRSTIEVTRNGRDAAADVQVAEFAADDITNVELYAWVAAITAYYSVFMEEGRHPKLVIEQRRKYGDTCQHQLKLMGFRRHHDFVEYDKKTLRPKPSVNGRQGWYTNAWSRPMLLGMFKYAVDGGWYEVNSRWLLEEMEGFEQRIATSGQTKMDHASGKHDDRIFAAAMSYFTMHDMDTMVERSKKRFNKPSDDEYSIDYNCFLTMIPGSDSEREFFEHQA